MDVLVKIYRPNTHPMFPNGGKFTPYLESLNIGDHINVEGPMGKFRYERGIVNSPKSEKNAELDNFHVKKFVFMAGGSGITPVYHVIRHIVRDPEDKTELVLIFANKSEEDILLKKELDDLNASGRVRVYYMIDNMKEGWNGFVGRIRKDVLEKITGLDEPDTLYAHCGPAMMNKTIRDIFAEYPGSKIYKF